LINWRILSVGRELFKAMGSDSTYLNIGAWQERSIVNGPGKRFVLWLQGCSKQCPGCINPEFNPHIERNKYRIDTLSQIILRMNNIEGITYTGGEPMEQARGLALLSEIIQSHGINVVCFTGYTLDELKHSNNTWISQLLSHIDILIDGPYIKEKAANLLWRGSNNQKVHFLSDTYKHIADRIVHEQGEVEFTISKNGFLTTGSWPQGFLENLKNKLQR